MSVASVLSMVHKEMKIHSTWSSHETAHGNDNHNTTFGIIDGFYLGVNIDDTASRNPSNKTF